MIHLGLALKRKVLLICLIHFLFRRCEIHSEIAFFIFHYFLALFVDLWRVIVTLFAVNLFLFPQQGIFITFFHGLLVAFFLF